MLKFLALLSIIISPLTLSASLIARYNFEYNSTQDISNNRNNGILVENATINSEEVTPEGNNYLKLDGNNSFLDCGEREILEVDGPLTISFWMKANSSVPYSIVLSKHNSYRINANNGWISFQIDGIDGAPVVTTSYEHSTWQHIAAVYDMQNMKIYVNGILKNSIPETRPISKTKSKLSIGAMYYGALPFNGKIDDVKIYNHALSIGEIRRNQYNIAQYSNNLVGYWNFDALNGELCDLSGYEENADAIINGTSITFEYDEDINSNVAIFDGNSYLNCGNSGKFNITNSLTLAAWIKPDVNSSYQGVISKAGAYRLNENGEATFTLDGVSTSPNLAAGANNLKGGWHHIAGIYNGTQMKIYIDGELKNTKTVSGNITTNANSINIGSISGSLFPFKGKIDDVRIYNCAISEKELSYLADTSIHFMANDGSNFNDGKTPETAWRTLKKINKYKTIETWNEGIGWEKNVNVLDESAKRIGPGTSMLFKRGDIWYDALDCHSGSINDPAIYADYGEGEKPMFTGAIDLNQPEDWDEENVEPIDVYDNDGNYVDTYYKYKTKDPFVADIGNILFINGVDTISGIKIQKEALFKSKDQYFINSSDGDRLYIIIKNNLNPARQFEHITCSVDGGIINYLNHSVELKNLQVKNCGVNGIAIKGGIHEANGYVKNIKVLNCDVSYCGGRQHTNSNGYYTRVGNGIEIYAHAKNILIDGCKVSNIYDAGLTNQGDDCQQDNICYRNNIIWNCEVSFTSWVQNRDYIDEAELNNITFENNTCVNAGYVWGHHQRDDCLHKCKHGNIYWGNHIRVNQNHAKETNIKIQNNIFHNSKGPIIRINEMDSAKVNNWNLRNNYYFDSTLCNDGLRGQQISDTLFHFTNLNQQTKTYKIFDINLGNDTFDGDYNVYQNERGLDQNSKFKTDIDEVSVLKDITNLDFHHDPIEMPCVNEGFEDPNPLYPYNTDIDGEDRIQGTSIDIGADEYHSN